MDAAARARCRRERAAAHRRCARRCPASAGRKRATARRISPTGTAGAPGWALCEPDPSHAGLLRSRCPRSRPRCAAAAWVQVIVPCARRRPAAPMPARRSGIVEKVGDRDGQSVVVVGGHDHAGVGDEVRDVALVGRHHRQACCQVVDDLERAEVEVVLRRIRGEPDRTVVAAARSPLPVPTHR